MPTLGDMLRMDENGRFTTSGKGESISSALVNASQADYKDVESEEHANHKHDEVRLIDRAGRLCGYYELWQTRDMPEELRQDADVVIIESRPTTERRLALLRQSFANPSITPKQSAEVTAEIDAILSARLGRDRRVSHKTRAEEDSRSEHELFVVRDANGLYLGMYSLWVARQQWPKSVRHGALINTRTTVPFGKAAAINSRKPLPEITGYSSRVDASLAMAKEFVDSIKRKDASEYWQQRKAFTYTVLHHANEPVCQVPYSCLESAFGDAWIVISRREVQLVTTWRAEEVSERAERAVHQAEAEYHEITEPGTMCLTESQFAERERKKARSERTRKGRPGPHVAKDKALLFHYVTRDKHGLFLGVFTLNEARKLWPAARIVSSVILVPESIGFADAEASISHTNSFETSFWTYRYKQSIRSASQLPAKLIGQKPTDFWKSLSTKRLVVYNNTNEVIAHLKPSEIEEVVGRDWFLSSRQGAQLVTRISPSVVSDRLRAIERRAYGQQKPEETARQRFDFDEKARELRRAERSASRKKNQRQDEPEQLTSVEMNRIKRLFFVYAHDGSVIYRCKKEHGAMVRTYLQHLLPIYAHEPTSDGMRLTKDISDLGFADASQLSRACAVALRGGEPSLKPVWYYTRDNLGRPITHTDGQVSFDGPEHVLNVFEGIHLCETYKHELNTVTGTVATLEGASVKISADYCHNCNQFYLRQENFERYTSMYGPLLGNFTFHKSSPYYEYSFEELAPKSILYLCGYNVNANNNLSSEDGHLLLANIMDRGICSKDKIVSHLRWLIGTRRNNYNTWVAIEKWEEDLYWVLSYSVNRQRHFAKGSIG